MKDQRQRMILRLIKENEIETQEELTNELARHGLSAAQATVSRDIRELKLVKTMGTNGRSCYAEPGEQEENNYIRRREWPWPAPPLSISSVLRRYSVR